MNIWGVRLRCVVDGSEYFMLALEFSRNLGTNSGALTALSDQARHAGYANYEVQTLGNSGRLKFYQVFNQYVRNTQGGRYPDIYVVNDRVEDILRTETEEFAQKPMYPTINEVTRYKLRTIVYEVSRDGKANLNRMGKIIRYEDDKNDYYRYRVDFLGKGESVYYHHQLLPNSESFDYYAKTDGYTSTVDCENLFSKGDPFIKKGDYLYDRYQSVVLKYTEFSKLFTKNDTERISAGKADKV